VLLKKQLKRIKEVNMTISDEEWSNILKFYGESTHATASPIIPYCALATVNEDGSPRVAPYTSMILKENKKGFYFDELSHRTSANLERDRRVCILIVKNKKWFWINTVMRGEFAHAPGIRLMGIVGKKREATAQEIADFKNPLKKLKLFKGYEPIWGFMKQGREIHFDAFEPVQCGAMAYLKSI
jgi:uncharacterized protein